MPTRRSLLVRVGALAAVGAGGWWLRDRVLWPAPRPAFGPGGEGSGWLALASGLPVPVVEASVNGRPVLALVDSGAQASVVDLALAAELGAGRGVPFPVVAVGVSGAPQTGHATTVDVRLGGMALPSLRVAALDLRSLSTLRAGGVSAALVIGQDVLRTVALDYDQPRDRLALLPVGARPFDGAAPAPARARSGELVVAASIEGFPLEAVMDTGLSAALACSEELALRSGLLAPGRPVRATRSVTFGGPAAGREVIAGELMLGERRVRHAPVSIYARSKVSLLPEALLGSGALRRTRAWIDLAGGRLLLAPAETPVRLQRFGADGGRLTPSRSSMPA